MKKQVGSVLVLALFACAPDSSSEGDDAGDVGVSAASAPAVSFDPTWTVIATGFGPIRTGQSLAEVRQALPGGVDVPEPLAECDYISPHGWPEGVSVMVVEGRVARVDVRSGATMTSAGARVGSTEREVQDLYVGLVDVRPHKYTAGRYLIVTPAGPSGADHRLVFETDGERVERYRAGALPAVEWVEGCG